MTRFLKQKDALAANINAQASDLLYRLQKLNVDELGMPENCLTYFKGSHFKRLHFSIQTSAALLYTAIKKTKKEPRDLHVMDYGAGVGTLFLLAKMIGFQKVIYNDHLEEWKQSAQLIAEAIGINIDYYIIGGINETLLSIQQHNIPCDIILSRNVIEHIYSIEDFFKAIHKSLPHTIIVSSTTANDKNFGTRIQHKKIHSRVEKAYVVERASIIQKELPNIPLHTIQLLASHCRGLAMNDFLQAISQFKQSGTYPNPGRWGTNTCDPIYGVWAEHLVSYKQYKDWIEPSGYDVQITAGFWDTHYTFPLMNIITNGLNLLIRASEKFSHYLAPFIYIIATPKEKA